MNVIVNELNMKELRDAEQKTALLPTNKIHFGPNPRRFMSEAEYKDISDNIRKVGIAQAITVRPHPTIASEYEHVCGGTRLQIANDLGLDTIPALIRELTDSEAAELALSENTKRQDMTPADEGQAARLMLAEHNNNKQEVADRLGWGLPKLEGRIALTRCIDPVTQALVDKKITLRHTEILSGLKEKTQQDALNLVLKNNLTPDQLREKIEAASLKLNRAIFDTTECQTCQYNSSTQTSLFATGQEAGRCQNKTCFEGKTSERLKVVMAEVKENVNRAEFDRNVAADTTALLERKGKMGVGDEQYKACHGCTHFGAIVSTRAGEMGKVQKSVCFDMTCHKEKMQNYQKLIATDAAPTPGTGTPAATGKNATGDTTSGKVKKTTKSIETEIAPSPKAIPAKIREFNTNVQRQMAHSAILECLKMQKVLAIIALKESAQVNPKQTLIEGLDFTAAATTSKQGRDKAIRTLYAQDDAVLTALMGELAALSASEGSGYTEAFIATATTSNALLAPKMADHFTMDCEYLKMHTKPMIAWLLRESGFASAHEKAEGEGSFKKLMGTGKGDILKVVEAAKFDFTGYVPPALTEDA